MKRFFKNSLLFIIPLLLLFYLLLNEINGYYDPFYLRFTTPKQNSLILGTSRAAQGILPSEINMILGRNDVYNYSFTIGQSPYGPTYLKSIKKKLKGAEKNGVFIVSVDPWSISSIINNSNDITKFRELNYCLATTPVVNLKPNIFYLYNNPKENFFEMFRKHSEEEFLHDDGWLEVSIELGEKKINENIEKKIQFYKEQNLPNYHFSEIRLKYLTNTIKFLKGYGDVYLVRLPVHPRMMEVDNLLMQGFNDRINTIISDQGVAYFDMTYLNNNYNYTDGNHLYKESGKLVSQKIANWILEQK